MSTEFLQQLGLSKNEVKIYEALLDLDQASVGEISSHTKVHRRNVYDTLKRLVDKALISPIISKGKNMYAPVDPDKLLELVREKEALLHPILPELRARYQRRQPLQEAYMYRGTEGFKNYMRDIVRVWKDVYFIGAKLGWFDPKLKTFTDQFLRKVKHKRITFHHIFDAEVKEKQHEVKDTLGALGKPYKFLPTKYSTHSVVDIFGDYVVTFTGLQFKNVDENVTLFILHDASLAESYRKWFAFMFNHLR